jgi:hypothetical protein
MDVTGCRTVHCKTCGLRAMSGNRVLAVYSALEPGLWVVIEIGAVTV